ncbi:MAG: glycosyltransferase family 39 protein [Chloroflexota bacterium]
MLNRFKSTHILLFVVGFALFWGLPSLMYPFGHDQGEDAYVGFLMSEGSVIYEDVYHVKPPGIPMIHILSQNWFEMPAGLEMMSIRLLDLFWQMATAFLIYQIGRRLFETPQQAIFPALLFPIMYYARDFWDTANSDGFLNLPIALAFLWVIIGEKRDRSIYALFVGLIIGVAFLIKYPIGIMLAVIGTLYLMGWRERRVVWVVMRIFWLAIGFIFPLSLFYIVLELQGTTESFFDFQSNYFARYNSNFESGGQQYGYAIQQFFTWMREDWLAMLILGAILLLTLLFLRRARQPEARFGFAELLPIMWLIGAMAHLIVQNKYYHYHTHPILPPLALVLGQVVIYAGQRWPLKQRQFAAVTVVCAAIVVALLAQPVRFGLLGSVALRSHTVEDVYLISEFFPKAGYTSAGLIKTSDAIAVRTQPNDYLLVWGFEPGIYYLSGRKTATAFVYNFPVMGELVRPQILNRFYRDLRNNRPGMIVIGIDDAIPHVSGVDLDSFEAMQEMPEFAALLQSDYAYVGQIDHFLIYDRVDG